MSVNGSGGLRFGVQKWEVFFCPGPVDLTKAFTFSTITIQSSTVAFRTSKFICFIGELTIQYHNATHVEGEATMQIAALEIRIIYSVYTEYILACSNLE